MTIAVTTLALALIAACFLAAAALQRWGLAGCLYLLAALLMAWADSWKAAKRAYGVAWPEHRKSAVEEAAR